ncbi:unnamed protein product [Gongylonema pulchrum]|uniref:Pecanex-like protein n=1 Tax=Gongylonema pulchrum TaxID=637853 RepID=A0A183E179_9BILA|nr:unnamed protein product [Gongylonema pulchrum]
MTGLVSCGGGPVALVICCAGGSAGGCASVFWLLKFARISYRFLRFLDQALLAMKIETNLVRNCNAEILIEHIQSAPDRKTFLERLAEVHEWQPQFGKSEMSRWAQVLNMCDDVLADAVASTEVPGSPMVIDQNGSMIPHVSIVLSFTSMLFENTFTRSVYGSSDVSSSVEAAGFVPHGSRRGNFAFAGRDRQTFAFPVAASA